MNIPKLEINLIYLILLVLLLLGILAISDIVLKLCLLSLYFILWIFLIKEEHILLINYSNKLPSKKDFVFIWDSYNKVRLYTRFSIDSSLKKEIGNLDCVIFTVNETGYLFIQTKPIFFKKEIEVEISKILENYQLTNK